MCQRDECWKRLGKRIRTVYVGQVARCQLLKCANFLKLQSFGLAMNLLTLFTLLSDCLDDCALFRRGGGPSISTPTSKKALLLDSKPAFLGHHLHSTPMHKVFVLLLVCLCRFSIIQVMVNLSAWKKRRQLDFRFVRKVEGLHKPEVHSL